MPSHFFTRGRKQIQLPERRAISEYEVMDDFLEHSNECNTTLSEGFRTDMNVNMWKESPGIHIIRNILKVYLVERF
jgi:hypothetical protein